MLRSIYCMQNLKPIETHYNGYRFRSRLEARWAVFFDACNTEYRYENEGYALESGWYLPDFWLPLEKRFVEVKPFLPHAEDFEWQKAKQLANATGCEVRIVTQPRTDADVLVFSPNGPDYKTHHTEVSALLEASMARFEHGAAPDPTLLQVQAVLAASEKRNEYLSHIAGATFDQQRFDEKMTELEG